MKAIVFTHFNDSDVVALEDNNVEIDIIGNGWMIVSGTWTVENSECGPDAAAGRKLAYIDSGDNNVLVDTTLRVGSSCCLGLLVRYTDSNNYFTMQVNLADQKLYIKECLGGSMMVRAEKDYAVVEGEMHRLWARMAGNNLRLYIGGEVQLSHNSPNNQHSTLHGLFANNPGADPGELLDFKVQDLGEAD